jgi:NAD(P)-dependent dehydrogenase (short-subunit alcohol dehydrogenase family)
MADAAKRVALITGANKGIGFEVARQVGKAGCTVLVGARNVELGREATAKLKAEGVDARFIAIDVVKHDTIKRAADEIARDFGRLDILVNNAGIAAIGKDGAPGVADIDAVRTTVETNFIGALAVTQSMLPLLKKSAAARIVNVSSELGSITGHGDPNWKFANVRAIGYSASKAAMNMMTRTGRHADQSELGESGIHGDGLEPESRTPNRRAGRRGNDTSRAARSRWPDRRILRDRRDATVVMRAAFADVAAI